MSVKILTEGFESKYFYILKEDAIRQITSILSSLNEAEMSDEDRRDTKILRDILAKASAAEYDKRRSLNYTPREIEVANKYNLELPAKTKKWSGTEISKLRDKDVDVPRGQGRDRYSPSLVRDMSQERGLRYNRNANLANYIRTRKEKGPKNERPYAQMDKFARNDDTNAFGDTTFTHDKSGRFGRDRWDTEHGRAPSLAGGKMRAADLTDVEKDRVRVNKEMSKPVKDMKAALKDREQHQQALDDIDLDYARDVSRARERFDSDMRDAEERKRRNSAEGTQGVEDANSRINKLLKKESFEEAESINEADEGKKKFRVNVHFEGSESFDIEASSKDEAKSKAEDLFGELSADKIVNDIADIFVDDCYELNESLSENANIDKLYEIADRYNTSSPVSGSWDKETAHEQSAISKELGLSMEEAKQVMIDQLGFTEEMFNESFSTRLKNKIGSLNEDEMSDEDKRDTEILKNIYRKTQARANAALTSEEKAVLQKYNLDRVTWDKNIHGRKNFNGRDVQGSALFQRGDFDKKWNRNKFQYDDPKADKINYADRARKRPARDEQQDDLRDRDYWDMPTPDYAARHERNADDEWDPLTDHTYQKAERHSENQKMTQNVRDMKRALRDRKASQAKVDSADADLQAQLDKLKKDYEDRIAGVRKSHESRTDYSRKDVERNQSRIDQLLKKGKQ